MENKKLVSYLFYAAGEIVLVVIGILIAVQINNWNEDRKEQQRQIGYYENIISDLEKDSLLVASRIQQLERSLKTFYSIYASTWRKPLNEEEINYDRMLYNLEFAPVTQANQQAIIEQLKDEKIRGLINDYFLVQAGTSIAMEEYNDAVVGESRPYFMSSVDLSAIFHPDTLGFLPRSSVLKHNNAQELLREAKGTEVLSYLRISSGYALLQMQRLSQLNEELKKTLTAQIK